MISKLKAKLIDKLEDIDDSTYVIAGNNDTSLRRTPKLMVAMCKTSHIVHLDWLLHSAKNDSVMESDNFLLLSDHIAENRYSFSMKSSIANGVIARKNGGILIDWNVYVLKGVAGNRAPTATELRHIIEAAGGICIKTHPKLKTKLILISSDPITEEQTTEHASIGFSAITITTTDLFNCIINQHPPNFDLVRTKGESNKSSSSIKSGRSRRNAG